MDECRNHTPACREESPGPTGGDRRWSPSISLVLPAYNEQETIVQAVCEADDALAGLTADYEILVVDDGSTDLTAQRVEAAAANRSRVRLLRQPRNLGYGAALRRGFDAARCDLVGFTDSDCQFHVHELERLTLLARDYEIVCG
jgi:glycosyltransferase involved in cell wall biosynthesis